MDLLNKITPRTLRGQIKKIYNSNDYHINSTETDNGIIETYKIDFTIINALKNNDLLIKSLIIEVEYNGAGYPTLQDFIDAIIDYQLINSAEWINGNYKG